MRGYRTNLCRPLRFNLSNWYKIGKFNWINPEIFSTFPLHFLYLSSCIFKFSLSFYKFLLPKNFMSLSVLDVDNLHHRWSLGHHSLPLFPRCHLPFFQRLSYCTSLILAAILTFARGKPSFFELLFVKFCFWWTKSVIECLRERTTQNFLEFFIFGLR